ncbi:hypothetical protein HKD37_08G023093 [Glycine soja]
MSHSHLNSLSSNCSSSMELEIGATHTDQTLEPWFPSDTSTGYLQDAIAGRGIWCKEQNLLSCSKDQKVILICLIVLFLAKVVIVKFLWLKIHYLDNQVDEFPMFSTTTAHPLHDCGFTHQKRFVTSNLSSSPQGDTHEAAIPHETVNSFLQNCSSENISKLRIHLSKSDISIIHSV